MSWKKEEKYKNFLVPVKKGIIKFDKGGNECIKTTFYKSNSLMVQDFWLVHYQILLIT